MSNWIILIAYLILIVGFIVGIPLPHGFKDGELKCWTKHPTLDKTHSYNLCNGASVL